MRRYRLVPFHESLEVPLPCGTFGTLDAAALFAPWLTWCFPTAGAVSPARSYGASPADHSVRVCVDSSCHGLVLASLVARVAGEFRNVIVCRVTVGHGHV